MRKLYTYVSVLLCTLCIAPASAQIQIPANDGFFTTDVSVISEEESNKFEQALEDIAQSLGQYIVVFFANDFYGKDLQNVAQDIRDEWSLPKDSVLLLISYKERRALVHPGSTVKHLSNTSAAGIVEKDIMPYMRAGEYNMALIEGVEAILLHLSGTYDDSRYAGEAGFSAAPFVVLLYAIVILIALSWLFDTTLIFVFHMPYPFAGSIVGLIIGYIVLQKYELWLSIPPLVIIGIIADYAWISFYKKVAPHKKRAHRRHQR